MQVCVDGACRYRQLGPTNLSQAGAVAQLVIVAASAQDAGEYTCQASNSHGAAARLSLSLSVLGTPCRLPPSASPQRSSSYLYSTAAANANLRASLLLLSNHESVTSNQSRLAMRIALVFSTL